MTMTFARCTLINESPDLKTASNALTWHLVVLSGTQDVLY